MTPQERKVMELALEALTHIRPSALTSFYTIGDRDKAITAIKEALAQPEQEPVAVKHMMEWVDYLKRKSDYGQHLQIPSEISAGACWDLARELEQFITTPPQPEQELDYKMIGQQAYESGYSTGYMDCAVKMKAQPEQEPVEWGVDWGKDGNSVSIIKRLADGSIEVLAWEYAPHPPQRTWVGLNDEDVSEIVRGTHNTGSFVRAITAKLKEKNI